MVQKAIIETSAYDAIIRAIEECREQDIPVVEARITASDSIDNGTSQKVYVVSTSTEKQANLR